ncbi:MAG TPA: hypothetical protein PKD12_08035 [Nitrospira sp.]|nr:hypothetical protein [Nitrospira sp.]
MTDEVVDLSVQLMVTTVDNPWDPFTQFKEWYQYDVNAGYNTSSLLARVVVTSNELSEADQRAAVNRAVEEIVAENVLGIYKKVSKPLSAQP